jgi:hypothetical protein
MLRGPIPQSVRPLRRVHNKLPIRNLTDLTAGKPSTKRKDDDSYSLPARSWYGDGSVAGRSGLTSLQRMPIIAVASR